MKTEEVFNFFFAESSDLMGLLDVFRRLMGVIQFKIGWFDGDSVDWRLSDIGFVFFFVRLEMLKT